MFGTVLITIVTLMHLYVFRGAAAVPWISRQVPRAALWGAALILWLLFFLGRVVGHGGSGRTSAVLEFLGMNWMAAVFLAFSTLLAVDLTTLFGRLLRPQAPMLRGWALGAGLVLALVALVQGLRPPVVQKHEVSVSGLPAKMDGTVIAALADTHLGSLIGRRWLEKRIDQVCKEQPDLVVLLGDIFEGHGPPDDDLIAVFQRLDPPLGIWAVLGNHEFYGVGGVESYHAAGFHLLRDAWAEVKPGLILAGVDDLTIRHRRGSTGEFVSKALQGRPPGASILLSHTPWNAEEAAAAGAGLMLSGHTHAGQIWPFSYLVRLFYPLFSGRYEVDGMPVIVSRGTGTWGPRMRLWMPGEILRVTLRAKR